MKANAIAALAAAALLGLAGAAQAQSGATSPSTPSPSVSGKSGSAAGVSSQGAVEREIKTQLEAMGYTEVGAVKETGAGVYETKAKRDGQVVSLRIDAKSGEIRERKG